MNLLPWEQTPKVKTESSIDPNWMKRLPNLNTGWAFLGQVGYNIFVLVMIALLFGSLQQFSDYLEGRGAIRDAERDAQEQQQKDLLCELIANLPAEPGSELYVLNERLGCATQPEPAGESPGEVPAAPSSEAVPSDDTGSSQDNGADATAGAPGVPQPTGTPRTTAGSATTVAPPVTTTPGSTARPQPTTVPPSVPSPTPEVPSQPDPAPVPGGILPGVDAQLCLPVVGCVRV